MANSEFNNGMGYKQYEGSRLAVHNIGVDMQLNNFKRTIKMAQIKALWVLVDFLTGSFTVLGIVANFDNVKSNILFFLALVFLMVRIYFYVVQKRQDVKSKDFDLWEKEEDKKAKISKNGKR